MSADRGNIDSREAFDAGIRRFFPRLTAQNLVKFALETSFHPFSAWMAHPTARVLLISNRLQKGFH